MDRSTQELIAAVTQQVLQRLESEHRSQPISKRQELVLVIGPEELVPVQLRENVQLCSLDCGAEPEMNYSKIIITALTATELAEVASGMGTCPRTRAICRGLLTGTQVYMTASAPEHRKYAGKCAGAYYELYEEYVRKSESYGLKLIEPENCKNDQLHRERLSAVKSVCSQKLITEKDALAIAADTKTITVEKGVIITPSAKDVFLHAGVTVFTQEEE